MVGAVAISEKWGITHLERIGARQVMILELLTLCSLLVLIFWAVGPLIEEWGLLHAFNVSGLGYIKQFAPSIPMRPFHLTAYALQWLLGAGHPIGVAAGTAVLLVLRYMVARWAVTPLLSGYDRWLVASLAATIAFWPGAWLGRYGSAQLSAVFFFFALGFAVRLYQRVSILRIFGCAVSVFLMLATYQGLTLCLIALPFASLLWGRANESHGMSRLTKAIPVCIAVAAGFICYALYWFTVSRLLGNAGYEGALAGDSARLLTWTGLFSHVGTAYSTAFTQQSHLLPLFLMIVFFMGRQALAGFKSSRSKILASTMMVLLVALLPMLSLIYVNVLHIRDIDRVLFPVSIGFVLLCVSLLSWYRNEQSTTLSLLSASIIVWGVVVAGALSALSSRHYLDTQYSVINQAWAAAEKGNSKSVVIRDTTGTLGDVYTLFNPIMTDAMAVLGKDLRAVICTPLSVDRIHPVAQRFPIASTARCEELPSDGSLVLVARWNGSALIVETQ